MTVDPQLIAAAVEAVKAEVIDDVQAGVVPSDVADYSSLHDYVDANMYGGDAADALYADAADHGPEDDPYASLRAMQDAVDDWIKAGHLREATSGIRCRHCAAQIVYRPRQQRWVEPGPVEFSTCDEGGMHAPPEEPLTV